MTRMMSGARDLTFRPVARAASDGGRMPADQAVRWIFTASVIGWAAIVASVLPLL